ncbi:MAG: hypothetical protein L0J30_06810 [Tetragenococcus koreensis]|nr:hypothetical protein [Tetragenococcus koreensis]
MKNNLKVKKLSGGTLSSCFHISLPLYGGIVIKLNNSQVLRDESMFLNYYEKVEWYPKLLAISSDDSFIIYKYIEGRTKNNLNKEYLLKFLVNNIVNKYQVVEKKIWGRANFPVGSWESFLHERGKEAKMFINGNPDINFEIDIDNIIEKIALSNIKSEKPYLLHGDLGIYNVIFYEDKINGIIDPMPIYGVPIYDLIFAYLSTPEEIKDLYILDIIDLLNYKKVFSCEYKIHEILFVIIVRIGRCLKHHSNDVQAYISAFYFWQDKLKK